MMCNIPTTSIAAIPLVSAEDDKTCSFPSRSISTSLRDIEVVLPTDIQLFQEAIIPLRRAIESQYRALPWPLHKQQIVVLTAIKGGRGDIVAAAKAISVMQHMCPTLHIDWVLQGAEYDAYGHRLFLDCPNPAQVNIRRFLSPSPESASVDFLLTGPVRFGWGTAYTESGIGRKIEGPCLNFLENALEEDEGLPVSLTYYLGKEQGKADQQVYQDLHPTLFPHQTTYDQGRLPMGLQLGSGVFLDKSRLVAPLSREYCCPSYLAQIQDTDLRKDILAAMGAPNQSVPNYDLYSFNMGYAHRAVSWGKFIDCVAIHEPNKHVVIVLNQQGAEEGLSTKEFQDRIFDSHRLSFLKARGFGTVILKGKEEQAITLQQEPSSRQLTIIIRPSFLPNDMRCMQLASERLLATGDNSAVEAWCARCKLYLYEDVANFCSCKWRFLQQQVDLAQKISPVLSRLLALFGGDRRLPDPAINEPLSEQKMKEMEELLLDPNISTATQQFCHYITDNFSFEEVLESAIKRTIWHHCIPELSKIETEYFEEAFKTGIVSYLKNPEVKTFRLEHLDKLGQRLKKIVSQYQGSVL